ncbi:hypothetical protein Vadar_011870 [Vaccinium darrowii]|uniref:Uncharacterized protein n=1 Tax=Vaccinium darrowii TaxID=229202 RepID=A0ACB7YN38_9ERIC|nr:hypothetical protein Vadar_011870 [Vaccinium darrowii]
MKNKAKAEKTETRLLNTSDYAWNKGNNGDRRHEKVLQKLRLSKKLSGFQQKKTGDKIGTSKSFSWESNKKTFFKKVHESHIEVLSKKIILLFVELPQLTVPLVEGRWLNVEKGVGSMQACGAIQRLSLETRGVTDTKEKELSNVMWIRVRVGSSEMNELPVNCLLNKTMACFRRKASHAHL